jgi:nanoRNase/pAp phosphatase (c-di-AMP/oligoRNAs hydrolase)
MERFYGKKVEIHFHKNCKDGFTSAYLFYRYMTNVCREIIFTPVQYDMSPPMLADDVDALVIVDFSYSVEQTEKYRTEVKNLVFMDHHLKAAKDHGGYCFCEVKSEFGLFTKIIKEERSGAGLMMDFLEDIGFDIIDIHKEVALAVEDRDLWNFKLPKTKYWTQVLNNVHMTFEAWDQLLNNKVALSDAFSKAVIQVEQYEFMVAGYVKHSVTVNTSEGPMALINCASNFASSVGETLSKTHAFACMFIVSPKDKIVICSLRSDKETGVDVCAIAEKHGGGGHRNAAGFSFSLSDTMTMAKLMDGSLF